METDYHEAACDTSRSKIASARGQPTPTTFCGKEAIWDAVSEFIEKQLKARKAVTIAGFGTFGFCQLKYDIGGNRLLVVQRPVFQAAERFLQTLGIQQRKNNPVSGEIPLVVLNYAQIAIATSTTREDVENCVREALQILSQEIASNRAVAFTFPGIGKLTVSNGRLKMRFFKEFVRGLDSSGRAVSAMQNRPGTADSVMSRASTPRSARLAASKPEVRPMQTIDEGHEELQTFDSSIAPVHDPFEDHGSFVTNRQCTTADRCEQQSDGNSQNGNKAVEVEGNDGSPSVIIASKTDEEREAIFSEVPKSATPHFCATSRPRTSASSTNSQSGLQPLKEALHPVDALPASIDTRPKTVMSVASAANSSSDAGSCSHANRRGLCYICYQREKRNIPASFDEEVRKKDLEEDKLLDDYHNMNVSAHLLRQRQQALQKRFESQQDAAFNLGIAEVQRSERSKRPIHDKFHPSFLFNRRARTPPRTIKQRQIKVALSDQINALSESRSRLTAEEAFLDKLEQVQNAEELARYRAEYERQRAERVRLYKMALDAQEQYKDEQTLFERAMEKDVEAQVRAVFCDEDAVKAVQQDRDVRTKTIAEELRQDALRKKELELVELAQKKAEEAAMLKRVAAEIAEDRAERHVRRMQTNQQLEESWNNSSEEKMLREFEEMRAMTRSPGGLVQEQLDKYDRCKQCKRKAINCGESHVYTDTRYTNGSRYVV